MEDDFFSADFSAEMAVDRFCMASGRAVMVDEDGSEEVPLVAFHLHNKGGGVTAHAMPLGLAASFVAGVAEAAQFAVRPDPKAGRPWYRRVSLVQALGAGIFLAVIVMLGISFVVADGAVEGTAEIFNFLLEMVGVIALVSVARQVGDRAGRRRAAKEAMKKAAAQVDGSHEAL